jgi:hypothetical protein
MHGRRLTVLLVAITLLVGAGCDASDEQVAPSPEPSVTTPSPRQPLTRAQYQNLLTGMERTLKPLVAKAMAATTLAGVDTARVQLAVVLEKYWKELELVTPPPGLESQHSDVTSVMISYHSLRDTFSTAMLEKTNSCGLPKPTNELLYEAKRDIYYTVEGYALEPATKGLAQLKLNFGKQLMPPSPERPVGLDRRGVNGKVVQRSGPRGPGRLQIVNDDIWDVAVSVVTGDPKKPQATIYVRANSKATLRGIRGSYSVYFKSGMDWDAARRGFTDRCSFEQFLQFFDDRSNWKISLAKTSSGNALTNSVPAF